MKLIRCGAPGHERPGLLLDDGRRIDASAFGGDYDEAFFGGDGLDRLAAWSRTHAATAPTVATAGMRTGDRDRRWIGTGDSSESGRSNAQHMQCIGPGHDMAPRFTSVGKPSETLRHETPRGPSNEETLEESRLDLRENRRVCHLPRPAGLRLNQHNRRGHPRDAQDIDRQWIDRSGITRGRALAAVAFGRRRLGVALMNALGQKDRSCVGGH